MTLKDRVLERFRRRRSARADAAIAAPLPAEAKLARIAEELRASIAPRRIEVSSAGRAIALVAARRAVLSAELAGGSLAPSDGDAARARVGSALADIAGAGETVEIRFSPASDTPGVAGWSPEALLTPDPAPDPQPEPEPCPAPAREPEAAPEPEPQPAPEAPPGSDAPFRFLDAARESATATVLFSAQGRAACPGRKMTDHLLEGEEVAGLARFHGAVSGALGDELLLVVTLDDGPGTTYAVALNRSNGAGVEVPRNRLGPLIAWWERAVGEGR